MDYFMIIVCIYAYIVFNNQIEVVSISFSLNIWKKSDQHVLGYIYGIQYSFQYMWMVGPDQARVINTTISLSLAYLISSPMGLPTLYCGFL